MLAWLLGFNGKAFGQSARPDADQVVVLFNAREPASREVALFYAQQRGIPQDHVIGMACDKTTLISRQEYENQIATPLRQKLEFRGLAHFVEETIPARPNKPEGRRHRLVSSSIRYLALSYGFPYRILPDPNLVEEFPAGTPPVLRFNGGSVDTELMLLPQSGSYRLGGPVYNPFYKATNVTTLHPTNGVFLVSRLDGPTPDLAKGLVTKAIQAERDGLWGRAYFDLQGLKDGIYMQGEEWILNAAKRAQLMGFETFIDRDKATMTAGFPFSDVALYAGWYDTHVSGPFTLPQVEFVPGAIAYHLHSFSAFELRNPNQYWVGPLIAKGVTVTLGCVDEPQLPLSPDIGTFMARLSTGFTVGEAFLACLQATSWQTLVIGDPLYRPFVPSLPARAREMSRTNSPFLPWAVLQTVNFQLGQGQSVEDEIKALEEIPGSTNSIILCEKLARLYEQKSQIHHSVELGQHALTLGGTPQQRIRLMVDLADWQRVLGRPKEAFFTLEQFAREFPKHPRILTVRKEQLEYARDLEMKDEISRLKDEIKRLGTSKGS